MVVSKAASEAVVAKAVAADAAPTSDEAAHRSTISFMRDYFAKQPREKVRVQFDQTVQINGYTFLIQAGERVEVPVDVARILEEAGRI